jgi:2-succinyl-6-hydroxy-2,4-cyclohexadiene-1-carboxylate synthase
MRLYSDSVFYNCTLHQSNRKLPCLLMLHGFMGSESVFEPLIDPLTAFCNPLTIDLIGHGNTITPDQPELFTSERQVRQIISILNRLQFHPLFLFGYSMGGRLAFQLLTRQSELFAGAIIESSHCGISSIKERNQRIKTDTDRAERIEADYYSFLKEWQLLPLFAHTPNEERQRYAAIMHGQNPQLMSASLRGFGTGLMPFVCDKLPNRNLPIHLIAGDLDNKYVNLMNKISISSVNINLSIVEGAGHRVHTDRPDAWIEILRKFISSHFGA